MHLDTKLGPDILSALTMGSHSRSGSLYPILLFDEKTQLIALIN